MDSLPSPAVSVENSPKSSPATPVISGRKRARSVASSEASSSKRAMSEDPSLSISEPPHNISSPLSRTGEDVMDSYMHTQGEVDVEQDTGSTSPASLTQQSMKRHELINSLKGRAMVPGETWYLISLSWYNNWDKACTGRVDKEGVMLENQLGPIDNSSFFKDGEFDTNLSLIDGVDIEYFPQEAWDLLVQWYGEPQYPISRQVITRGINNTPTLELRPPVLQVHRLISESNGANVHPSQITISSQAKLADLYQNLSTLLDLPSASIFRVWVANNTYFSEENIVVSDFIDRGQLLPASSDVVSLNKTIDESLIASGDKLVVEVCEGDSWLLNESDTRESNATADEQSIIGPVFNSGSDYFSKMSSGYSGRAEGSYASTSNSVFAASSSSYGKGKFDRKETVVPGTLGFVNMGNTCFMNSALQCLGHQQELVDYFLTGVYTEELNPDNPLGMQGAIAKSFGTLLNQVWKPSKSAPIAPREFKMQLQRFAPQFSGYQQHDSQELVAFLLDGLHEDLNRVLKKPYVEKPDWEGGGDKELIDLANKSWEGYMKRNDSVIVDLFQGQYKSTLVCPECDKVSITFDPFMYLTLPLPVQKKWRLNIFYIPWDLDKPHVKVPVELDRNSTFRDVRRLLGRWMEVDPDNLLTLESFSDHFYKNLDDSVMIGDMSGTDIITCFELPCHAQQSRTWKPDPDPRKNPVLVPVYLVKEMLRQGSFRRDTKFIHPFFVVLDDEQVRDQSKIYAAVVERLERWTQHSRDLYRWESMDEGGTSPMLDVIPSATETEENGEISFQAEVHEERDIVDEHPFVLQEELDEHVSGSVKRLGPKPDLFEMHINSSYEKYGIGQSKWTDSEIWKTWEERSKADENDSHPQLLFSGDVLYCEWEINLRSYFFGDNPIRFEHPRVGQSMWEEFIHPELKDMLEASLGRAKKNISLDDCLREFTKEEQLGEEDLWYCPQCKKHQQATKKFDLWTIPDILVVHLKRFSNNRSLRDKIDAFVDFPIEGLDLESFCGEREVAKRLALQGEDLDELSLTNIDEPLVYDLFAVDEHIGGLGGGHYYAYAQNHLDGKWYHFEDSHVMSAEATDAVNESAYLLFYKRRTNNPIGGKSIEKIKAALQNPPQDMMEEEESISEIQLPTPPDEDDSIQMKNTVPLHNYPTFDFDTNNRWGSMRSSPSPSPAEDELADNGASPLASVSYDGNDLSDRYSRVLSRPYNFVDPSSSMASPASSNAAELGDIDDTSLNDLDDSSQDGEQQKEMDSEITSPAGSKLHDIDI